MNGTGSWQSHNGSFHTFSLPADMTDPITALTLAQANTILTAALAKSKAQGYKPMAIAVLDGGGNLTAFASEDGASMFRFDIARAKAWGAVGMGVSSRALGERAKDNPNFFVSLSAVGQGRFVPQTGAVVIKDAQGQVIGAVEHGNGHGLVALRLRLREGGGEDGVGLGQRECGDGIGHVCRQ